MSDYISGGGSSPFIVAVMRDFSSHHTPDFPMSPSSTHGCSFSRPSISFIVGFALGTVVGIIGVKYASYILSINHSSNQLLKKLETVQQSYANRTAGSAAAEAILDTDTSDDEFFDASGGFSSDCSGEFKSAHSSSVSLFSLVPPNQPLPTEVIFNLDKLAQSASCASSGPDLKSKADIYYFMCLEHKKKFRHHPAFLWRFTRAVYFMYLAITTHPTPTAAGTSSSDNSDWIDVGLSIARSAVRQADIAKTMTADGPENLHDMRKDAARAYQWLAVFIGLLANSSNTAIAQRIQLGYEFERYISISLDLDPKNAYCHILKGRWCYEVYNLSWVERQIATRLFATPPLATLEDAKSEFLEAERLAPNQWAVNAIFLARCAYAESKYESAVRWLNSANRILSQATISTDESSQELNENDSLSVDHVGDLVAERPFLQKELEELLPLYRSYLPR
nr:regulator of microtubule dynamics protein [Hymenolepis microstoma]